METEETIFATALQLPPEQRGPYLDEAAGREGPLRQRVELLLRCVGHVGEFLEEPASGARLSRAAAGASSLSSTGGEGQDEGELGSYEKPGDSIGRYKLLQQI